MKEKKESIKKIYLKQIAENIKKFRQKNGLSQTTLAKSCEVDGASISQWENTLFYPTISNIEKLEKMGIPFTKEQKDVAENYSAYNHYAKVTWEEKFDRIFTRSHNKHNAPGYDGDDWKYNRMGEPPKPSAVKAFIKEVVLRNE